MVKTVKRAISPLNYKLMNDEDGDEDEDGEQTLEHAAS
jgi:hypothetical protein